MSLEATAQNLVNQLNQKCVEVANVSGELADAKAHIAELEKTIAASKTKGKAA